MVSNSLKLFSPFRFYLFRVIVLTPYHILQLSSYPQMAGLEEGNSQNSPCPSPAPLPGISALETGSVDKKTKNPNEINWAGDNDQLNPRNWPVGKKWLNLSVISIMTLSTYDLESPSFSEDISKQL